MTITPDAPAARRPRAAGRARPATGPLTRRQYLTTAIVAFIVLLAAWAAVSLSGIVNPLFLPSPFAVVAKLGEQAGNGELWSDMGISTYRVMVGFLASSLLAIPIGVLCGALVRVEAAVEPIMDFIRYMPVVAFVPLTILWVGTDDMQKFLIIFLGTFFQQVLMFADAVRRVPVSYRNLGATLGLSSRQILTRIVFPSALPRIWDALRISLGWAWTWLVVAELVAATSGMGYRITQAQRFLETDLIIGYVIVLGLLGLVFDQIMRALGRRFFRYLKGRS
ncbi:ABC transporter permease [Microbacterium sp. zg.Y1090]|uniref:ABC transporter permease n=1 Tax=Microbacterium TaxID=33882 RepID=UPI00214A9767|nr:MULTISPECIES: ABC transporter permease [unclassified Microbacterium]MCR2812721.1 ABC transporter permease [Microbacterium sp. zg.Y1084]MCR2817485.1 ABC transporter permease [Microbacterium sp. zg.Y1090]MDL5485873.1 ABC transporter permease [Microbacterium sp. zg-Y1211]WIM29032.1 ABC transporter permease [Microbacterium sp. zg-Y1090]